MTQDELIIRRSKTSPAEVLEVAPRRPPLHLDEVFPYDRLPTFTFIEPNAFDILKHRLRTRGTGLLVEGAPKVGKSTAVHKALEALQIAPHDQIWWHGRQPPALGELRRILAELRRAERDTWLFVEDCHHLDDQRYLSELAAAMNDLAAQPVPRAKITLIGIKPLQHVLTQWAPELADRLRVVQLNRTTALQGGIAIAALIGRGEYAASLRFKHCHEIITEADGSYFLGQYLCHAASTMAGAASERRDVVEIHLHLADVLAALQGELAAQYRQPLIDFAMFDDTSPPRGATLSLLWLLSRSPDGVVQIRDARLKFPTLAAAFKWLADGNLAGCIHRHPALNELLFYCAADQTLTMLDPRLRFYLHELDWEELAHASGHGRVRFHVEDGLLLPSAFTTAQHIARAVVPPVRNDSLLHLSDLRLATKEQAVIAYAQLEAALREQEVDAIVVTGDLVARAGDDAYDPARLFLEKVMAGFSLSPRQIVLVPGNRDVNWEASDHAYVPHRRRYFFGELVPGAYIEHQHGIIEVREEAAYRRRFQAFAEFYRAIKGHPYPLAYEEQGIIDDLPELGICVLSLNSAWESDHHFSERASIHPEALVNALLALGPAVAGQLRIAAFHHPMDRVEDMRTRGMGLLQLLAMHGFRLVLHSPATGAVGSHPAAYNLLRVSADELVIGSPDGRRCRASPATSARSTLGRHSGHRRNRSWGRREPASARHMEDLGMHVVNSPKISQTCGEENVCNRTAQRSICTTWCARDDASSRNDR